MLSLTAGSAAASSLAGMALAKADALVPYDQNYEQLKIYQYGFKEFVLLTPLVQEIARYGLESLTFSALSGLGYNPGLYGPACAISTLFGMLHFYNDPESTLLSSSMVVLKNVCFSFLRGTFGFPSALIAHSAHNLLEYIQSKNSWEMVRAKAERELRMQGSLVPYQPLETSPIPPLLPFNRENLPKKSSLADKNLIEWKDGDQANQPNSMPTKVERTKKAAADKNQPAAQKKPAPAKESEIPIFKPQNYPLLLTL